MSASVQRQSHCSVFDMRRQNPGVCLNQECEKLPCLEIKEKMMKNFSNVVRDRSCFKLRCNTDKEVCITVKQSPSDILPPLFIERCFGVLLSPGKLVRQADMQLLDMASMGYIKENANVAPFTTYQIRAEWKANDRAFEQLNLESQKTFLTVAVDLVRIYSLNNLLKYSFL